MRVSDKDIDRALAALTRNNETGGIYKALMDLRDERALLREAERGLKLDERAIDDNLALAERIRRCLGGEQ